jgi:hypothetical protein
MYCFEIEAEQTNINAGIVYGKRSTGHGHGRITLISTTSIVTILDVYLAMRNMTSETFQ